MKALTISQPYASLISSGEKFVENRTWETKYRGPLAIHAGKGTQYMTAAEMVAEGLPTGQIIATGDLQACVELEWSRKIYEERIGWDLVDLPSWLTLPELLMHEYTEGPWCWIITNVQKIEPVVIAGKLGLWNWEGAA